MTNIPNTTLIRYTPNNVQPANTKHSSHLTLSKKMDLLLGLLYAFHAYQYGSLLKEDGLAMGNATLGLAVLQNILQTIQKGNNVLYPQQQERLNGSLKLTQFALFLATTSMNSTKSISTSPLLHSCVFSSFVMTRPSSSAPNISSLCKTDGALPLTSFSVSRRSTNDTRSSVEISFSGKSSDNMIFASSKLMT